MKTDNDLLLRTIKGEHTERPPVWLMRQAGRILPEYRALRQEAGTFKRLVETPALACEATLQPVDALGVDAAILFSDILVVPEAMGLPYEMQEKTGPWFPKVVADASDIEKLRPAELAADELQYVYDAIALIQRQLDGRVPLIGFCGAPWTIFAYMVEGKGSKTFSTAKGMLYRAPELAHRLLEHITATSIAYLKNQVSAGVQVVQLFDSWAGLLSPQQYREFSVPYLQQIAEAIQEVPKTIFAKGAWFALEDFGTLSFETVGLDWTIDPAWAKQQLGTQKILQGNLDPCQLYATPETVYQAAQQMVTSFGRGHIANLGHGVYPDTPLENVRAFVSGIKASSYAGF